MEYSFEKLLIWKIGMNIASEAYRITKSFPKEESWGLTSQMRRAATSIPLNIAEGSSRKSKKDFSLFLRRALGSAIELETAVRIATEQNYISTENTKQLKALAQEEYFKIIAFEKTLQK